MQLKKKTVFFSFSFSRFLWSRLIFFFVVVFEGRFNGFLNQTLLNAALFFSCIQLKFSTWLIFDWLLVRWMSLGFFFFFFFFVVFVLIRCRYRTHAAIESWSDVIKRSVITELPWSNHIESNGYWNRIGQSTNLFEMITNVINFIVFRRQIKWSEKNWNWQ